MDFYSGFVKHYDFIFPVKPATVSFMNALVENSGAKVLDLGCGTAELLNQISTDSPLKTGVDLDEYMILEARKKFPEIKFHQLSIVELEKLDTKYDLIYSTGNVLSYLNRNDLSTLASTIKASLNNGGKFAAQIINWNKFSNNYNYTFPQLNNAEKNVQFYREYKSLSNGQKVAFHTKLTERNNIIFEGLSTLYPVLKSELCEIFVNVGFKSVSIFGDFSKAAYRDDSPAIIMVCE